MPGSVLCCLSLMLRILVGNINMDLEVIDLNIIGKSKRLMRLTDEHFLGERRAELKWQDLGDADVSFSG